MILATTDPDPQNFWTALTVLASLLTGFLGGWATLRAANPRRQLAYWMPAATRLLHTSDSVGDLVVMRGGQTLRHPHVLDVRLMNRGRRDVASSHFDSGTPIRLNVGAPIVEVLDVASQPGWLHTPTTAVDDTALTIAPGLIAKGQTIHFSVLVDGPAPRLTCQASLIDVTVQEKRETNRQSVVISNAYLYLVPGLATILLLFALAPWVEPWFAQAPIYYLFFDYGVVLVIGLVLLTFVLWGAVNEWSRRRRVRREPSRN
ncbi:hypothetical protein [Streptomyces cinnamoneus]|uniref:Uncharacterized protein n=1 Tax=Streptomyces cinnamoneus TaxID=53446 RepID=A0A918TZ76_STRCJ|nr:hypothetical protein [Streptomyces cinnamoneus]GHC73071.1 hypothetical protein GCM10010507_60400 [Streptomyces cinnamoneus]